MKKEMKKIVLTCPYCAKKIISLYQRQAEYNIQAHIISCKEREEEKNGESSLSKNA